MGTRADFYVGRGKDARWLGSIAFDGYPVGTTANDAMRPIWKCTTARDYRSAVAEFLRRRDDATLPSQGWPWPWEDSGTSDYAYAYDRGAVYFSCFGHGWHNVVEYLAFQKTCPRAPRDNASAEAVERYEKRLDAWQAKNDEKWEGPKVEFPNMKLVQNVTYGRRSGVLIVSAK